MEMLADVRHCTLQFSGLQRNSSRQPYIYYGPTGFMLPSVLRTSVINRQPVDNQHDQSANMYRFKISREFGGFGWQWLSEIAAFSWLPEVGDRSLSVWLGLYAYEWGTGVFAHPVSPTWSWNNYRVCPPDWKAIPDVSLRLDIRSTSAIVSPASIATSLIRIREVDVLVAVAAGDTRIVPIRIRSDSGPILGFFINLRFERSLCGRSRSCGRDVGTATRTRVVCVEVNLMKFPSKCLSLLLMIIKSLKSFCV